MGCNTSSQTSMPCVSNQQNDPSVDTKFDGLVRALDGLDLKSAGTLPSAGGTHPSQDVTGPLCSWMNIDVASLIEEHGFTPSDDLEKFKWWDLLDKLDSNIPMSVVPDTKRKTWKTIRLFVSSTFKDMNSEREHLVKHIFPQLRHWCEERKLRLIECDLRWGIPKDADTSETFIGCLSQIDRCREENGCPYFLCMLSERYGWTPAPTEVPDHIKAIYKWMPGMSVTSLEIFTGAYWDQNPNALFMLRQSDYLNDVKNKNCRESCTEASPKSTESLTVLKGKLREKFPQQIQEYRSSVSDPGAEVLELDGLEDFGLTVLENFKSLIERQYPSDSLGEMLSLAEIQKMEHENFMIQRSQVLLGRDAIMSEVRRYITSQQDSPTPLILVGSPGAGKSAILAYSAKEFSGNPKYKIFYHFVGATPGSTDIYQILTRLWTSLLSSSERIPPELDEMIRSMEAMFTRAAATAKQEKYERLVILIDALNQMDDEADAKSLRWLPDKFPENMRVVVSTLDGKSRQAFHNKNSSPQEILVDPLNMDIRKQIVTQILSEYSKALDTEQLGILVAKEDAGRPLWLAVACEELRMFGNFKQLTQKIVDLPAQLTGLLEMVLSRIVAIYGNELVKATLCLIESSRFGLLETELVELLALQPSLPTSTGAKHERYSNTVEKIPMAIWARVFLGLKQYMRPCGNSGEGRLDFYHRTISKVVRRVYLVDQKDHIWWHTRLADYFENCTDFERKAEELPYHLEMTGDLERLKKCLLDKKVFLILYQESTKLQLMKYWQLIGGYDIAASEYMKALASYKEGGSVDDIDSLQVRVGWFLVDIGQYEMGRQLLEQMIASLVKESGQKQLIANCLEALVTLFYREGIKFVYGSNPGYKVCRKWGSHYSTQCIQIHKDLLDHKEVRLGQILGLCGYFCGNVLEEARKILEEGGDKQGLAQVLYFIGEKNQYHDNMTVPMSLYEQSLELCKSQFGQYHLHTARCYQLYGQLYWNRYVTFEKRRDWMEKCLGLYTNELDILEELLGPAHPTTVRSREDVIIILQNLGRKEESAILAKKQPLEHDAL